MKKNLIFIFAFAMAALNALAQQKPEATVPQSQINAEKLNGKIDYNMDVSKLSLADLRILRNAPAAKQGFPFKDSYIRGVYATTSWYDSLMWKLDEKMPWDKYESSNDESYEEYYYRVINDSKLVKYSKKELAFMKRLQDRINVLQQQNFKVPEGLRVNLQNVTNPLIVDNVDPLLTDRLSQEGFAIVPQTHSQLFQVYEENDYHQMPNFVTTDLYLQLFHLYVDCTLRRIEQNLLMPLMSEMSAELYKQMQQLAATTTRSDIKAYATHNAQYFAIASELLTGKALSTDEIVKIEVEKAMKSKDAPSDFMEDYKEIKFGYSLFRPRGHYTRTDTLKRYFRGMMWLQSVPFGMDHENEICEAIVMADVLSRCPKAMENYQKYDRLITWLMGKADNLSIPQVQAEIKRIGLPLEALLDNPQKLKELKASLEKTGNAQTRIRPAFERTSHNKICLLPQRYQPDAEVLLNMVDYKSEISKRPTPKGLDVFAALGVSAAEQILMEEQTQWEGFTPMLQKMKQRMGEINWQETLATQWIDALKTISDKDPQTKQQLPYFMLNPNWEKKDLNAMLASWAELKHDAILYAKQPMGAECGGGGPPDPIVKGYVEPNVRFWEKAIQLLDNLDKLFKGEPVLEDVNQFTTSLKEQAEFLLYISKKELAGEKLDDADYRTIEIIGSTFENISLDLIREPDQYLMGWDDVQGADKEVALVADVYTANADNNPHKSILYEAVGFADEMYVVVEIEGYLYIMRGAVLSYREFTRPINEQRLTDEEWQLQLRKDNRKGVPEWMQKIIVPLEKLPATNEELFYSSGC